MSRFRKIDTRIIYDEKFRDLSDDGKLVFMMLLVHPNMTALGAMRASIATLAEDLEWSAERFRKAFDEPLSKGMARYDERARMVALPNFLKFNAPENPNVVKAWSACVDLLPEGNLKAEVIQWAYTSLHGRPKSFAEAFAKSLGEPFREPQPNGMANKEKEKEQEPEQEKEPTSGSGGERLSPARATEPDPDELPFDPPETVEEGKEFLSRKGVPHDRLNGLLERLMRSRLYPCDLAEFVKRVAA
jgi:hypothetical protein